MIKLLRSTLFCALGMAMLAGCAAEGPREGFAADDPYEPTNRVIHEANVELDRFVLKPVSEAYDFVTPTLFRHLIGNGLSHLDLPNDFVNYVLQGDVDASLETLGRFTLNTILGAGGLLDPATEFGLKKQGTDFGITMGKYGVGEGFYVVLPFLGPSTLRDGPSSIVDRALNPLFVFSIVDFGPSWIGPATSGLDIIDFRATNAELLDDILYNSPDPYVTLRAAYLQRRRAMIAGEEGAADNLPDIFEDQPEPAKQ